MPARTHGKQAPFVIRGTVTVDGSVYQGAEVYVRDTSEGTMPAPVDDYTRVWTNSSGQYLINLAQSTQAYSNGDTVRVYCRIPKIDKVQYSDITIRTQEGSYTVNFTVTRYSGLVDGCKPSPLTSGKGTLNRQLVSGCKDGMT